MRAKNKEGNQLKNMNIISCETQKILNSMSIPLFSLAQQGSPQIERNNIIRHVHYVLNEELSFEVLLREEKVNSSMPEAVAEKQRI